MCGIFGITKTTKFNQSNVSGATLLCRRGPDNEGDWQNGYIKLKKLNFKLQIYLQN
jgi:asparagine synthetase B (glutamine-hydrolysing)